MPRWALKHIKSQEAGLSCQEVCLPEVSEVYVSTLKASPVVVLLTSASSVSFDSCSVNFGICWICCCWSFSISAVTWQTWDTSWLFLNQNCHDCLSPQFDRWRYLLSALGNHCEFGMTQESALCYIIEAPKTCFFCVGALPSPVILTSGWVAYCLAWNVCPTFPTKANGCKRYPIEAYHTLPINWARQTLQAEFDAELCNTLEVLDTCPQETGFYLYSQEDKDTIRHLYWSHSETSLKTQSLRGKMHATWPGVYWIGRVFGSSVGTTTGDRLTGKQGNWMKLGFKTEMTWAKIRWKRWNGQKKTSVSNTVSCSVLGSLVSCCPHLLKAPRTWKVYLSVGEARLSIDYFSTFCEIVDIVWYCDIATFLPQNITVGFVKLSHWDSSNWSGWWQNRP